MYNLFFNRRKGMKNKCLVVLAAGCVCASAATINNYDLLGRKGSNMNSPMVYKNVDYSKAQKDEQKNEVMPFEKHALMKTGMGSSVEGIEGAYDSRTSGNKKFFFRKYKNAGSEGCNDGNTCFNWSQYKTILNNSVVENLKIKERQAPQPTSVLHHPHAEAYVGKNFYWAFTDPYRFIGSGYEGYSNFGKSNPGRYNVTFEEANSSGTDQFPLYSTIKNTYSQGSSVSNWYDNTSSEVGVFMGADALPVNLGWEHNAKFAGYIRNTGANVYEQDQQKEVRDSRTYGLIKAASTHGSNNMSRSVVYVGKGNVTNTDPNYSCVGGNCLPQVYIGVRNNNNGDTRIRYNNEARSLDDYIYEKRTIEFVPSGYSNQYNPNQLYARGFASNAITVGAVELVTQGSQKLTKVSSDAATASNGEYNSGSSSYHGTNKPEIFNYTHFQDPNDLRRYYYDNTLTGTYGQLLMFFSTHYYDSEVSAAYTAGMVSNLLATNPFYRWHPEVVKAILLTSNGRNIDPPYVDLQVTTKVPSYKYLVFNDQKASNLGIYSRYWNGDINKLKVSGTSNEIFFVVDNRNHRGEAFSAAISWLNKGSDIEANNGVVPQDFDLYVYGKNSVPTPSSKGTQIAYSTSSYNSFERVDVQASKANYDYLAFRIVLAADNTTSQNRGQIVLGFNLAVAK